MNKKLENLEATLLLILFLLSLFIIGVHFFSNSLGFYFTGDTISSFETSVVGKPGNLLNVFVFYYPVWPPAMGFAYSILRVLPFNYLWQHHIYVFGIFTISLGVLFLLVSRLSNSNIYKTIIITLVLLSGVQGFIFHTALSDPLFVFFWLSCLLFITCFFETQKERYLLCFSVSAIGLTLSRYSGISILFVLMIMIFIFAIKNFTGKKFSFSLLFLIFVNVWAPISIYLLRNIITDHRIFGLHDKQFPYVTSAEVGYRLFSTIIQDVGVLLIICLLIGAKLKWNRSLKIVTLLSGVSSLFYILFLYFGFLNYRIQDGFRSRLAGISYPELLIGAFGLGAYISYKFPYFRKFVLAGLIIGILFLGRQGAIQLNNIFKESETSSSQILGTEYSQDIKSLCDQGESSKYLFIQPSSRNWTAQSLRFYCLPIKTFDVKDLPQLLKTNSFIYSAYKLDDTDLKLERIHDGEKQIYIYRVLRDFEFKPSKDLLDLTPLD